MKPNGKKEAAASGPFLDGRREWMEQIGGANRWVPFMAVITFGSLAVAGVAVHGMSQAAKENRYIPYTVDVDELGFVRAVGPAVEVTRPNEAQIKAQIGQFITGARSVSFDASNEKQLIEQAYGALTNGTPAKSYVDEFMRQNSPFERAQSQGVTVEMQSVLNTGGDTWRVEWIETVRGRAGENPVQVPMQAAITTTHIPPTDEATIFRNPLGIYVKDVSWSQRLK